MQADAMSPLPVARSPPPAETPSHISAPLPHLLAGTCPVAGSAATTASACPYAPHPSSPPPPGAAPAPPQHQGEHTAGGWWRTMWGSRSKQTESQAATSCSSQTSCSSESTQGQAQQQHSSPQLSTQRVASSIPLGAPQGALPAHQQPQQKGEGQGGQQPGGVWMYPSEQMFYNAMKRKVCVCV